MPAAHLSPVITGGRRGREGKKWFLSKWLMKKKSQPLVQVENNAFIKVLLEVNVRTNTAFDPMQIKWLRRNDKCLDRLARKSDFRLCSCITYPLQDPPAHPAAAPCPGSALLHLGVAAACYKTRIWMLEMKLKAFCAYKSSGTGCSHLFLLC